MILEIVVEDKNTHESAKSLIDTLYHQGTIIKVVISTEVDEERIPKKFKDYYGSK